MIQQAALVDKQVYEGDNLHTPIGLWVASRQCFVYYHDWKERILFIPYSDFAPLRVADHYDAVCHFI